MEAGVGRWLDLEAEVVSLSHDFSLWPLASREERKVFLVKNKRVTIIVLDSVGVGELPDAAAYGDTGSNTLAHTATAVGGLHLPHLGAMGLGNVIPVAGVLPVAAPRAAYGKMAEVSAGKDTTTGHWEIAGLILDRPFPTYPEGFPPEVIKPFEQATGRKVLGNKPASGTEIINELGTEHLRTGRPIVYTSADSVFQIAAHEEIIPLERLYEYCRIAREILVGKHGVGRVIARPFVGEPGSFARTPDRRDFSLPPPRPTLLDAVKASGMEVAGVGKIEDIFAGQGLTQAVHTEDNRDGVEKTLALMEEDFPGLIFTNLVDFDMRYGHRNDPPGYARALEEFDAFVPQLQELTGPGQWLVITADHGCDPTTSSTDHSREYVPLLVFGPEVEPRSLEVRESLADVAASAARFLGVPWGGPGKSWEEL